MSSLVAVDGYVVLVETDVILFSHESRLQALINGFLIPVMSIMRL